MGIFVYNTNPQETILYNEGMVRKQYIFRTPNLLRNHFHIQVTSRLYGYQNVETIQTKLSGYSRYNNGSPEGI